MSGLRQRAPDATARPWSRGLRTVAAVVLTIAFSGLGASAAGPALAAEGGLLAHWRFDDSDESFAEDASGEGHRASISGASRIADGQYGGALQFDGVDDIVTVPPSSTLRPREGLTVSAWVRGTSPVPGSVIVAMGRRACDTAAFAIHATESGFEFRIRDNYTDRVEAIRSDGHLAPIWDGKWHHIAAKWQPWYGRQVVYVDGREVGRWSEADYLDYTEMTDDALTVGSSAPSAGCAPAALAGAVDDLRIYEWELDREQLGAMEPPIATTTTLTGREIEAWMWRCVTAVVEPVPAAGGVRLFELRDDGTERYLGHGWQSACTYGRDLPFGTFNIPVRFEYAGVYRLRAEFVPGLPWQPSSSAVLEQTVDRIPARTVMQIHPAMPDQTIAIETAASGRQGEMGGSMTLFETTGGTPVELETHPLEVQRLADSGSTWFYLPPRPKGTYSFEVRYSGTPDLYLPSAASGSIDVDTGLTSAGPVRIDSGAATTTSEVVQVDAPATGAVRVRLSNNGKDWHEYPYSTPNEWDLRNGVPAVDWTDRRRTVFVQWQDEGGRWSTTQSDTITMDTRPPVGTVSIAGGATHTRSQTPAVSVAATDATTSVTEVSLSNDGRFWYPFPYQPSVDWMITAINGRTDATNGTKTVHVRWKDDAGNWSPTSSDTIILDTIAPAVTVPVTSVPANAALGSTSIPVTTTWTATDQAPGSGVGLHKLQLRRYSAASREWSLWSDVTLPTPTARSATRSLAPGVRYQFRVAARDKVGNWSAWKAALPFTIGAHEETSRGVGYSGTWTRAALTAARGGYVTHASRSGASATLTFTGRHVALVSDVGPERGAAEVWLDGVKVATIDLYASELGLRRVVFSRAVSASTTHRLQIRVTGTRNAASASPRVDVDAFVVLE